MIERLFQGGRGHTISDIASKPFYVAVPSVVQTIRPLGTSEATDRFATGEPGSSGRLDARGAGSSVTVAAKGVRVGPRVEVRQVKAESAQRWLRVKVLRDKVLGGEALRRYSGWSDFGVWWIKSSAEARHSKCAPEGDIRRCPTKVSEVEAHRRHGPGEARRGVCSGRDTTTKCSWNASCGGLGRRRDFEWWNSEGGASEGGRLRSKASSVARLSCGTLACMASVHGLTEFELRVAAKPWWSTPEVLVRRPKGFEGFG
ncbi:hypothetical protein GUJ93_ZPchr0006g41588 [Zizania palustris]|uniref:Uncharacterized protein n=1 Tax=Zizania palustris TaxID=103762 RepID=A0A8J5VQP5_ZIZPA|nr:hypothetical protein GUJ93_ZPchr0006g41588 [Zizania palustris]